MEILSINETSINNNAPVFSARGKALALDYIIEKRSQLIPERVYRQAKLLLSKNIGPMPSLLQLHKDVYTPLLECKTLDEAKTIFTEFSEMREQVEFQRKSVYSEEFKKREGENFALRMLKEFWVNLKTKDEIAKEMGMPNRTSLEWPLKQIKFVSYHPNYKTILKASDIEGNREIAAKTTSWNKEHADLMLKKNKHAAQFCKTDKYRQEQSERMKKYDLEHPERKEKISKSGKEAWERCPEVRKAMAEFASLCSNYMRKIMVKKFQGQSLSPAENRISKWFFKRFWDTHPELKKVYADAKKKT